MKRTFEVWLEEFIALLIFAEFGKEKSWKYRNEKRHLAEEFYNIVISPSKAATRLLYPEYIGKE